jgi:hypothetical protein
VLDEVLAEIEEIRVKLPPTAQSALNDFLEEWKLLALEPVNRRRYSERMYELAFVLHRHSPEAYDLLRQALALPAASSIQEHFAEVMAAEKKELLDTDSMSEQIKAHVTENLVKGSLGGVREGGR